MPKKILLVEDDRKMLDVMRRYLENRGFSVKGYPFSTPMVECDCNRPYGVIRRSGPSRH